MNDKKEDRRNRICPACGMGVMPGSVYCVRCGEELTPMAQRPEVVEFELERKRLAKRIWLFDIFPGLLSIRVSAVAASCIIAAVPFAALAGNLMSRITGVDALFFLPASAGAGIAALLLLAAGLILILHGKVENPLQALYGLPGRRLLVFLSLMLLAIGLYGFLRSLNP